MGSQLEGIGLAAGYWALVSLVVGLFANSIPLRKLDAMARRWIPYPFEQWGTWYERRLRIRRWKRLIPESGRMFRVGYNKSYLHGEGNVALTRLMLESVRGEFTHRVLLLVGLLPMAWLRGPLVIVPIFYVVVANLPCLAIVRYNRIRTMQTIVRRRARGL